MAVTEDPVFSPTATPTAAGAGQSGWPTYWGWGNLPQPATPTEPPTEPPMSAADRSAQAILFSYLEQWGLGELATWAWDKFTGKDGGEAWSIDEIMLDVPNQQPFIDKYPAYHQLAQEGRAIKVEEYQAYTRDVLGYLNQLGGAAQQMYGNTAAIADLLIKDVSRDEVQERIALAADAAFRAPKEVTDALKTRFGLDQGDLIGYWLDPDKAIPLLEKKKQYAAAQIQGAATAAGQETSYGQYDRLVELGVDFGTARQGYDEASRRRDLTNREFGQAEGISREDVVGSVFGEAGQARRVDREAARRAARYRAAEGGAAAGSSGVSGLGTANR